MRICPVEEVLPPQLLDDAVLGTIRVWPVGNRVGESPVWHAREQALYWIDVRAPALLRLDPTSNSVRRWTLPEVVGALALAGPRTAWLALQRSIAIFDLDTGELRVLAEIEGEPPTNRLNEGKPSPSGRWFVFGSMDDRPHKEPTGKLYCMDRAGHIVQLADGLVVANGIAFSPDGKTLYHSDSQRGSVFRADWDEDTGRMGTPVLLARLDETAGRPDGAAIDAAGGYWSAGVSAGVLNRLDVQGRIALRIALPCRAPTMPCFGGVDGDTLFVTSLVRPQWPEAGPMDGALLALSGLNS